ncbi:MAG: hypothetical protein ACRCSV_03120 [Chlamydiales bacterium]
MCTKAFVQSNKFSKIDKKILYSLFKGCINHYILPKFKIKENCNLKKISFSILNHEKFNNCKETVLANIVFDCTKNDFDPTLIGFTVNRICKMIKTKDMLEKFFEILGELIYLDRRKKKLSGNTYDDRKRNYTLNLVNEIYFNKYGISIPTII